MSHYIAFGIELVVCLLLLVSIGYSIVLDRHLRGVKLGEAELRKTIQDLNLATDRAGKAVETLRIAIGDSETELAEQLWLAERRKDELALQIKSGADFLQRITQIVGLSQTKAAA